MLGTLHTNRGGLAAPVVARHFRLVAAIAACIICGLFFALSHSSARTGLYSAAALKPALLEIPADSAALSRSGGFRSTAMLVSTGFDQCVQDDTDRSMIVQFSSTSGAWQFSKCDQNPPILLIGTGTVRNVGCWSLVGTSGGSRVTANFSNGCLTGSANVSWNYAPGLYQTFSLHDSNTNNNTCTTAPVAAVLTPNGGEILDAGSSFNIAWSLRDTVSILSQDLLYSTDGGNTYTTIVTGLAPSTTQYAWTVPSIANNRNIKVSVVEHDASCNSVQAASASTFTIFNPGTTFSHVAEAPFYVISDEHNSIATITNTSSSSVTVELTMRSPTYGSATANLPTQLTLAANQVVTVNMSNYLTIPTPADELDPNIIMGSVRLRHNGTNDTDIQAVVATDHLGFEQSFTTPFVYPASFQTSSDGRLCGPMYYMDSATSCYLAIQNTSNNIVSLTPTINYGTGASGTPNGSVLLPVTTLYPQQTVITNLSGFSSQLQGTDWGSIGISAPPQTVVAHCVSSSGKGGFAFNSNFIAPGTSVGTTKVASPLKIDPVNGHDAYIMVCNLSSASRTVTATFNTNNGVSIPQSILTIGAGQQQLLEVAHTQVSTATLADVRLTYSGSASDIVAGACSMSATDSRALPGNFVEPKTSDGRRLMSPLMKFDPRTSGIVQVSNVSASSIKAGVRMRFAGATGAPSPTSVITVPANGTATLDLKQFYDRVPDGTTPAGSLELIHTGTAGSVTASFTAVGNDGKTPISQGDPLVGGPPIPGISMFPVGAVVVPGTCTEIDAVTDGSTTPSAQATSADQCFGTATLSFAPIGGSSVLYSTSLCVPIACSPSTSISVNPPAGTGDSIGETTTGTTCLSITTTPAGGQLEPGPNLTPFTIALSCGTFPAGSITVEFDQMTASVTSDPISSSGTMTSLNGTAPANSTAFIGDVTLVKVLVSGSTKPFGKIPGGGGLFYAYDAPTVSTISPSAQDRAGGRVTITGSGFKVFNPNGAGAVYPTAEVKGFPTKLIQSTVTDSSMVCKVKHAPADLMACTSCINVKVVNPGNLTAPKCQLPNCASGIYGLNQGPAAMPNGLSRSEGPSSGGTMITISGSVMYVVYSAKIGSHDPILVTGVSASQVTVVTPPSGVDTSNLCPPGAQTVTVSDIDNFASPVAGTFTLNPTPITAVQFCTDPGPICSTTGPVVIAAISPISGAGHVIVQVGPCGTEGVSFQSPAISDNSYGPNNCGTVSLGNLTTSSSASFKQITIPIIANSSGCSAHGTKNFTMILTNSAGPSTNQISIPIQVTF